MVSNMGLGTVLRTSSAAAAIGGALLTSNAPANQSAALAELAGPAIRGVSQVDHSKNTPPSNEKHVADPKATPGLAEVKVERSPKLHSLVDVTTMTKEGVSAKGTYKTVPLPLKRTKVEFSLECPKGECLETFWKLDPNEKSPAWIAVRGKDNEIVHCTKIDSPENFARLTIQPQSDGKVRLEVYPFDPTAKSDEPVDVHGKVIIVNTVRVQHVLSHHKTPVKEPQSETKDNQPDKK